MPNRSRAARVTGPRSATRLLALGAVVLAAALGQVTPAAAATAGTPVTLTGTYQVLAADPNGAAGAPTDDVYQSRLLTGSGAYVLHLPGGARPQLNSTITLSGLRTGKDVAVSSLRTVSAAPATSPRPTTAAAAPATSGTRVLVILASWTQPDYMSPQQASSIVFGDANAWYREVSYGATGQFGDVTPWVHIAGPAQNKCYADADNVMVQAKTAARAVGYDSTLYDRTIVYFPNDAAAGSDCSLYGGWAYVSGTEVWINGYLDKRVVTHEQGHSYGLWHAHTYGCTDGSGTSVTYGPPSSCVLDEYGDPADAMGSSSYVGHFSAAQKDLLGWMAGRKVALSPGASMTLAPFETSSASDAGYVVVPGTSRTYWLEYRRPSGQDASLPTGMTSGVLVHVTDPALQVYPGQTGPFLLDQTPATAGDFTDASLGAGKSWTSPEGYVLTVGSVTATGASVSVSSSPPKVTSLSPASGPAAGGTQVTIKGSNLLGAQSVTFGATTASFSVVSSTELRATAPAGSAGTSVTVAVHGPTGVSAGGTSASFAYTSSAGQPDLVVTNLSWTPTSPVVGSAVRFSATIQNKGSAATPAGVIHGVLFKVDGAAKSYSDTDTASLAPGASITLTANSGPSGKATWPATAGTHSVAAQVDDQKRIAESNESNNTLTKSFVTGTSAKPDLVVTALAWSPATVNAGNAVTFKATVKNQGSAATPSGVIVGVLFTVDGTPKTFTDTDKTSLAPGASVTLTASGGPSGSATWVATAGTHTVTADVDDVNRIAEGEEGNNTLAKNLTVASTAQPDLIVTALTASPAAPTVGSAVRFTVTIKNQGSASTPAGVIHGVLFKVDGVPVTWTDTDTGSLAVGASITLTANSGPSGSATWKATAGSHTLLAFVDDQHRIAERNESNNTFSRSLVV